MNSQKMKILAALKRGRKLTPDDARKLCGSDRLSARIGELLKVGHNIHKEMVYVGPNKRVAQYYLKAVAK